MQLYVVYQYYLTQLNKMLLLKYCLKIYTLAQQNLIKVQGENMKKLLALITIVSLYAQSNSNIGVLLDIEWINETSQKLIPMFENYLQKKIIIPEYNFTIHVPGYEQVSIQLGNIIISQLQLQPEDQICYIYNGDIFFNFIQKLAQIQYEYNLSYAQENYKGTGTADLNNFTSKVGFNLTIKDNSPLIVLGYSQVDIAHIFIDTQIQSDLQQALQIIINDNIQFLEQEIDYHFKQAIEFLNQNSAQHSFIFNIPNTNIGIDLKPESVLNFQKSYVSVAIDGTIFDNANPQQYDGPHSDLQIQIFDNQPIQAYLSDFAINSISANFYDDLYVDLRNNYLPITLTTSDFTQTIPQLAEQYGEGQPVSFILQGNDDYMVVSTDQGNLYLQGTVNVTFLVEVDEWQKALTIGVECQSTSQVYFEQFVVQAYIDDIVVNDVQIYYSAIGQFDHQAIVSAIQAILDNELQGINDYLSWYQLQPPEIDWLNIKYITGIIGSGFTEFGLDLSFNLQELVYQLAFGYQFRQNQHQNGKAYNQVIGNRPRRT